jgi:hypothetical protein
LLDEELPSLGASVTVTVSTDAAQPSEINAVVIVTVSDAVSVTVRVGCRRTCFAALKIEQPMFSSAR